MSKRAPKTILKTGYVNVSPEDVKLFDRANKRINALETASANKCYDLKKEEISSFHNSARAITRGQSKQGMLSKSKRMSPEQYDAQMRLANKIVNDDTMTVLGAMKEYNEQRKTWTKNLSASYPGLKKNDLDEIYDELVKFNQENYEDSPLQWLYQTWKDSEHSEQEHGLVRLLEVGKSKGMSVKDSLQWMQDNLQNQTWHSLSQKYLAQWETK